MDWRREIADYFHLRIRNEESKIGRQYNACRGCITVGLFGSTSQQYRRRGVSKGKRRDKEVSSRERKEIMSDVMEEPKENMQLWCSTCREAIQPENYFEVKIRSEVARMEHSYNICRECAESNTLKLPSHQLILEEM